MRRYDQDVNLVYSVINFALSTDVANLHQQVIDQSPTISLSPRPSCTEFDRLLVTSTNPKGEVKTSFETPAGRPPIHPALNTTRHAAVFGPKSNLILWSFCHRRAIWRLSVAPLVCSSGDLAALITFMSTGSRWQTFQLYALQDIKFCLLYGFDLFREEMWPLPSTSSLYPIN